MKNPATPLLFALALSFAALPAGAIIISQENAPSAPEVGSTNSMGGNVYPDDFVGPLMPNDCRAASCTPPDIGASSSASGFDFMSAFNPPEGTKWADPNCTRIPCAIEPTKEEPKAVENKPLPNGDSVTTFADGTVSYTSNGQTSGRMTPEELAASNPRYKEALDAAAQDDKMFQGNSKSDGTASNGSKKSANGGSSERSSDGGDGGQLGGGTLDGFSVGQDLGNEMGGLYAGNGAGGSDGPSGLDGSGRGADGGMSAMQIETIAGQTGNIELTYERNIENQARFAGFADEAARLVEDAQRQVSAAASDPSGGTVNTMQIGTNKK